jgi:hypothetical protein
MMVLEPAFAAAPIFIAVFIEKSHPGPELKPVNHFGENHR